MDTELLRKLREQSGLRLDREGRFWHRGDLLGDIGYDPTYGARPLKRVISKRLVDPLALGLLKGEFAQGDRIEVDAADGELRFATAAEPALTAP